MALSFNLHNIVRIYYDYTKATTFNLMQYTSSVIEFMDALNSTLIQLKRIHSPPPRPSPRL